MEQLVGTMQNTHGEIDERLKEIASANKETSSSTATIATQLQAAETQISVMAGQSAATSVQLAATSAEVQNMAVPVNAMLKFNSDRARYDSASRGLKHDGSDMQEIDDYDSKWCAVMDAARVPGLLHLENDLRDAALALRRRLFSNIPLTFMHPLAQTRDITHSCFRASLGGETALWLGRGFLVPFPSAVHAGGTPCGIEHAHSATCNDGLGSPGGGVFCGVVGPFAATFLGGCGSLMEMVPYPSEGSRRAGAECGLEPGLVFVCGLGRRVTMGLVAAIWAFGISSGAHTPDDSAKGGKDGAYRRDAVRRVRVF